jgi:DNA-binding transcriptional MerR regulator
MNDSLITIGELAERVGITVRTLQYYDQAGILKPSVKGKRNQRLYTSDDVEKLYRILCMKFMGVSLDEIKNSTSFYKDAPSVHALFKEKSRAMEEEFSELLKRFTTMKNLIATTRAEDTIDWTHYASIIKDFEDGGKCFWQLSCVYEEGASKNLIDDLQSAEHESAEQTRQHSFREWHELIADVIELMHENTPLDDPRVQTAARHYRSLKMKYGQFPPQKHFILTDQGQEESQDGGQDHATFGGLRNTVSNYLERALDALPDNKLSDTSQNDVIENKQSEI